MARHATKNAGNIYLIARIKAGIKNRGIAAGRLYIDESTLERYESGKSTPAPDRVLEMEQAYGDNALAYRHCTEVCPLGIKHDKLEDTDLPLAALALIDEHNHLGEQIKHLVRVVADGKITEDEWDIYQMVDRRMMRLRQKITTLHLCAASQKNTTSAKVV